MSAEGVPVWRYVHDHAVCFSGGKMLSRDEPGRWFPEAEAIALAELERACRFETEGLTGSNIVDALIRLDVARDSK